MHTQSYSLSHTHTLSLSHTDSLSHAHTLSLSHAHTHAHIHSHGAPGGPWGPECAWAKLNNSYRPVCWKNASRDKSVCVCEREVSGSWLMFTIGVVTLWKPRPRRDPAADLWELRLTSRTAVKQHYNMPIHILRGPKIIHQCSTIHW